MVCRFHVGPPRDADRFAQSCSLRVLPGRLDETRPGPSSVRRLRRRGHEGRSRCGPALRWPPTIGGSRRMGVASAVAENLSWSGMRSAVRRRTQGALAPSPDTPVIVWSGITMTASPPFPAHRSACLERPGLQTIGRWGADSGRGPRPCGFDRADKSRPRHATASTTRHGSPAKLAVCGDEASDPQDPSTRSRSTPTGRSHGERHLHTLIGQPDGEHVTSATTGFESAISFPHNDIETR